MSSARFRGRTYTPVEIASRRLDKALAKYSMSEQDRRVYRQDLETQEQLRYLNMNVMAAAIIFIHRHGKMTEANFTEANVDSLVESLIPTTAERIKTKMTSTDLAIMKIRLKVSIARYITYYESIHAPA